jgi:heme exporter protein A
VDKIELKSVSKTYGRSYALNRVSTTFRGGTLVVLLGPNGAGKSTLLSIVCTLLAPDRGTVTFDGQSFDQVLKYGRGRFGYVSHDALLYLDLTGIENLRFYAKLYGIPEPEERIAEMLDRVEMTYAADKFVRGYSRGMRQRLSIARALLQRPEVLLLDEPFTGLDRWGEESTQDLLAKERDAGRTILLSTHQLGLPKGLVNEVRVLKRGRMLVDRVVGEGERIADIYAEAFAAKESNGAKAQEAASS